MNTTKMIGRAEMEPSIKNEVHQNNQNNCRYEHDNQKF